MTDAPAMSVIVVTVEGFPTIRAVLNHLRQQTAREELEIVVVATGGAKLPRDAEELRDFPRVQVVELGRPAGIAAARAAGVWRATAPVVALVEDHSWPRADWAEKLIAAHRRPYAAVGPALVNGNPDTLMSWTNLLIEYGPWIDPAPRGLHPHLPGHNGSYKRGLLIAYGDRLDALLDAESVLHWDLRRQGHELWLEADAKTVHFNFSRTGPSLRLRFNVGRMFASSRARAWSGGRRLAYALAAPLIPAVRFGRIARLLRLPGRPRHLWPRLVPLLGLALVVDATGEFMGYLAGPGRAGENLTDMEVDRPRNLTAADQRRFAAAS